MLRDVGRTHAKSRRYDSIKKSASLCTSESIAENLQSGHKTALSLPCLQDFSRLSGFVSYCCAKVVAAAIIAHSYIAPMGKSKAKKAATARRHGDSGRQSSAAVANTRTLPALFGKGVKPAGGGGLDREVYIAASSGCGAAENLLTRQELAWACEVCPAPLRAHAPPSQILLRPVSCRQPPRATVRHGRARADAPNVAPMRLHRRGMPRRNSTCSAPRWSWCKSPPFRRATPRKLVPGW